MGLELQSRTGLILLDDWRLTVLSARDLSVDFDATPPHEAT